MKSKQILTVGRSKSHITNVPVCNLAFLPISTIRGVINSFSSLTSKGQELPLKSGNSVPREPEISSD